MAKCENLATRENEKLPQPSNLWHSGNLALLRASELAFQTGRRLGSVKNFHCTPVFDSKPRMKRWTTEETLHSETRNSLVCFPGPESLSGPAVLSLPSAGQYQHLSVCLPASNLMNYSNHKRTKQRFSSKTITEAEVETPRKKRKAVYRSFHYYKRKKRKGLFLFKVWGRQ